MEKIISFYDKKTIVVLKVLWFLVKNYLLEDKQQMLRKIEQIIVFYKPGLKKKDVRWVNYHVSKLNVILIEYKRQLTQQKLLALIFMVSEHYRLLLKNETRKIVWENLETYSAKIINKNKIPVNDEIEFVEKIYEEIVNDNLYLKSFEKQNILS